MGKKILNKILINKRYVIGPILGKGSFGDVFLGTEYQTGKKVAIKMEHKDSDHPILFHEYDIYQQIYKPNIGIPKIYYYGIEGDYKVLIMDKLGASLEDLFNMCRRKFTLRTVLMIADQMINRLEYLHKRHYIHRDIKPENFLVGTGNNNNQIYLVDLGLAKKYRNATKHISYKEGGKLIGTARYASINSHKGIQLSRRDDMESLGYVLIYFLRGKLPWQNIKATTKQEKYLSIQKNKDEISLEDLCKNLPNEFVLYMQHVKSLKFTEAPSYLHLKQLFRDLMGRKGYVYDLDFQWC